MLQETSSVILEVLTPACQCMASIMILHAGQEPRLSGFGGDTLALLVLHWHVSPVSVMSRLVYEFGGSQEPSRPAGNATVPSWRLLREKHDNKGI